MVKRCASGAGGHGSSSRSAACRTAPDHRPDGDADATTPSRSLAASSIPRHRGTCQVWRGRLSVLSSRSVSDQNGQHGDTREPDQTTAESRRRAAGTARPPPQRSRRFQALRRPGHDEGSLSAPPGARGVAGVPGACPIKLAHAASSLASVRWCLSRSSISRRGESSKTA